MRSTKASETGGSPWIFDMRHRLSLALEVAGVSVQEMADELEVSANTVGNYTSGRTTPKLATLRVWALKTGAPIEWIRTGVDPTENPHPHNTGEGSDSRPRQDSNLRPMDYEAAHSGELIDLFTGELLSA